MTLFTCKTPIVLIIFNRPNKVAKVIELLRCVQPRDLFVIADGPRLNVESDFKNCANARRIIDKIDWECEINKNYSDQNLGCSKRVSSGLNWVFENTSEAIILEDDCIPDASFFKFAQELLEWYRNDSRVFSISGQNVQFGRQKTDYDYYFSRYNHCWGWATWRRAWSHFDYDMALWNEVKRLNLLYDLLGNKRYAKSWERTFDYVLKGEGIDSWAFRWTFSCWIQNALHITPSLNLVTNVGHGENATHTSKKNVFSEQPAQEIVFPIKHPPFVIRDSRADEFTQKTLFNYHPTIIEKVCQKIQSLF
ncbi:MAG: glycosyltransferase family 2 protein [Spirulina sp.]